MQDAATVDVEPDANMVRPADDHDVAMSRSAWHCLPPLGFCLRADQSDHGHAVVIVRRNDFWHRNAEVGLLDLANQASAVVGVWALCPALVWDSDVLGKLTHDTIPGNSSAVYSSVGNFLLTRSGNPATAEIWNTVQDTVIISM